MTLIKFVDEQGALRAWPEDYFDEHAEHVALERWNDEVMHVAPAIGESGWFAYGWAGAE